MNKDFEYRKYEGKFGTVKVYANASNALYFDSAKKDLKVTTNDFIEILCNGIIVDNAGTTTYKPIAVTANGIICSAAADAIVTFTAPAE